MTQVAAAPEVSHRTCLITVVTPGSSDRVIKVFPAEAEREKIWLDNTPGIERWEAVLRLMNNHAERGTRVPNPAPWHSDSKDLNKPDLKEEDIPLVRLDGAILKAPPKEERVTPKAPLNQSDFDARMQAQAARIDQLTDTIGKLAQAVAGKPSVGTDEKTIPCDVCQRPFKNKKAVRMHKLNGHKG